MDLKITDQVEFYFSDANLNRDKFLRKEVLASKDGYVDLKVLITFNRLKALLVESLKEQAPSEKDLIEVLVRVLEGNNELELDDEKLKIRRKKKFVYGFDLYELNQKTVLVKGFPEDSSFDQVLDFLKQECKSDKGTMSIAKKRKDEISEKQLSSEMWVEFQNKEASQVFLEKSLEFNGVPLKTMSKVQYLDQMGIVQVDAEGKPIFPNNRLIQFKSVEALENATDCMKTVFEGVVGSVEYNAEEREGLVKLNESIADTLLKEKSKPDTIAEWQVLTGEQEQACWKRIFEQQKQRVDKERVEKLEKKKLQQQKEMEERKERELQERMENYKRNCLVRYTFKGDVGKHIDFKQLKASFSKLGNIKFVETPVNNTGVARFDGDADKCVEAAKDFKINDIAVEVTVLEGDEERDYHHALIKASQNNVQNQGRQKRSRDDHSSGKNKRRR